MRTLIPRVLVSLWLAFNSLGSPDLKQQPAYEDPPPEWLIRNVERWLPLIQRWHPDFPDLDPAWILALIAQESQGDPYAVADDLWNSTGLMQVGPRPWIATSEQLLNPATNIYVGMRMLNDIFNQTNGNLRFALAAYNCGFEGVEKNWCGSYGGYKYADRIIDYWLPVFRDTLWVRDRKNETGGENILGYRPTCEHSHTQEEAVPGICLDPFLGSGTTVAVAKQLLRRGIGIDISMEYLDQQAKVRAGLGTPSNALDNLPLFQ